MQNLLKFFLNSGIAQSQIKTIMKDLDHDGIPDILGNKEKLDSMLAGYPAGKREEFLRGLEKMRQLENGIKSGKEIKKDKYHSIDVTNQKIQEQKLLVPGVDDGKKRNIFILALVIFAGIIYFYTFR